MTNMYSSLPQFLWHFSKRHLASLIGLLTVGALWAVHFCLSPTLVKSIIDNVAASGDQGLYPVLWPFLGYVSLTLLLLGISAWYDYLTMTTFPAIKAEAIESLQNRLLSYPYTFFQRQLSGSIANKISDLAKGTISILTSIIDDFFCRTLLFFLGVGTLYLVHPLFAAALLSWVVVFFAISYLFSKETLHRTALFSEARSTLMGKVVDSLTNMFTIKIFGTRRFEQQYIHKHLEHTKSNEVRLHKYLLRLKFFQGLSITLLMIFMVGLLFHSHSKGWITLGDFALVLTLTTGIVDQTFYLALKIVELTEDIGVARQALAVFKEPANEDPVNIPSLVVTEGSIKFDNVSFFYTPFKAIFQNLTLQIASGEKVGVVGLSGSGKSTLAHLLLRLYEVTSGKIFIDGQNISAVSKESVVSQIGMIPQEPYLFHRSIYENILYGKLNATKEEVIAASMKARCHDFIIGLPQAYDTLVGERGVKLSGGQRQRIAIARAFLKNAPILILDEATSALDSITEGEIQQSLSDLMQERTVLVIAHRLSTLASMDRILVFEHGKLLEQGSHEELISAQGRYAQLWTLQTKVLSQTL